MTKPSSTHTFEALFAVTVWGASFIATKVALQEVSPVTVVWLRFAIGVVILGAAVASRGQFALPSRGDWGYFALLGFLGIAFHQWLQSTALLTSRASTTAWIVAVTPVFMALLGWLALREGLRPVQAGGIALAALGVALVVSGGDPAALAPGAFGQPGDALVLASAANWALFSVLSRRGLAAHPPAMMMFYVMASGWAFTSVQFFAGPGLHEISNLTARGWSGVAFLGLFCSGLAYIAWYDALQALPAAQLGAFLYLEPPIAVLVAGLVLGEALTWTALLGGAGILLGVWMVNKYRG